MLHHHGEITLCSYGLEPTSHYVQTCSTLPWFAGGRDVVRGGFSNHNFHRFRGYMHAHIGELSGAPIQRTPDGVHHWEGSTISWAVSRSAYSETYSHLKDDVRRSPVSPPSPSRRLGESWTGPGSGRHRLADGSSLALCGCLVR